MRRYRPRAMIALAFVLALLLAGCYVVWQLARTPLDFLIVPGAVDIEVQSIGLTEHTITYRSPGAPYGWYFAIIRSFSAGGWSAPVNSGTGLRDHPETHWRISQLWFVYVDEEITLQGEPHVARIHVRRRLIIPWRQLLP